jgi:molecular chaperone DnaJ
VPGDLIVAIEELEHEFWSVKVRTCIMIYTLVSWSSSYFKDIEAINGKVRIKLEEGIQSGKILRLKERYSKYKRYASGDLLVHVNVWTPKP